MFALVWVFGAALTFSCCENVQISFLLDLSALASRLYGWILVVGFEAAGFEKQRKVLYILIHLACKAGSSFSYVWRGDVRSIIVLRIQ